MLRVCGCYLLQIYKNPTKYKSFVRYQSPEIDTPTNKKTCFNPMGIRTNSRNEINIVA